MVEKISNSYVPWQESSFPGLLGNVVAGRIANRLDLKGTNCVVDAACASSLSALHLAALELEAGRCDMALAGGLDTFNDIFMYMCFSKTPALSPDRRQRARLAPTLTARFWGKGSASWCSSVSPTPSGIAIGSTP